MCHAVLAARFVVVGNPKPVARPKLESRRVNSAGRASMDASLGITPLVYLFNPEYDTTRNAISVWRPLKN